MVFNVSENISPEIEDTKLSTELQSLTEPDNKIVLRGDREVSDGVNYHTISIGNRTLIRIVEGEIAHVTDSQEVKENENTVSIPVFHRTPIQKRDLNELIRDLESQNVSTRVAAVRRIKSGKVPTNNNLLILALNDDAWSVQI